MMKQLEILYEDKDIVVCHKAPGIPVQTSQSGRQDMVSLLKNHYAKEKGSAQIYVVHRLDQPVEGVMVFARTKKAAASLSRQMQEKGMEKQYLALAEGIFAQPSGALEDYLLRDGRSNTSRVVSADTKGAKKARLSYKVQAEAERVSLVQIQLETGRHHQIRVQLAHAGHPLAGDKKYNPQCRTGYCPIALCSVKTGFLHPQTGEKMEFSVVPYGEAFQEILHKCKE